MGIDVSPLAMIVTLQVTILILGMFLDPMGIILLCLPIFYPVVKNLAYAPIF